MQRNIARVKIALLIPLILMILVPTLLYGISVSFAVKPPAPVTIDPKIIPKYVNQLVVPPVFAPDSTGSFDKYTITMAQTTQQILPTVDALGNPTGFGPTTVWGYQGNAVAKGATLGVEDGFARPVERVAGKDGRDIRDQKDPATRKHARAAFSMIVV